MDARELYEQAKTKVKVFNHADLTKKSPRACRVILKAPAKATKNTIDPYQFIGGLLLCCLPLSYR